MRILLAVDGSVGSEAAVKEIAERPLPPLSSVRIISAVDVPFFPTPETWALPESYYSEIEKGAEEQAQSAIKSARQKLLAAHGVELDLSSAIIGGHPKEVILDEAEKWQADLVVLGSHGNRGWERFLLGSVSQAVASHASCSVQIVRQRKTKPPTDASDT